ncbi:4-hydroxybenzoate polyprenyltransferase and related prenyltransferases [Olavius algarvensis associated proteobacterium Delta 3]|nr:4-hydroxybenzoate polyprenyltransferase and related prenyltransferases [Olavius algarvensis associated proteobacterium Delta 3]CAB5094949.1 4-hydroxybenzoate polyprenyltransferase and related prenyltransferases [Olavius algarvensis associated proteobacterium Delta 3]
METSCNPYTGFARIKLFWALSRTPHGLLDMATPAAAALLWLGSMPPLQIVVLGLITTFAGYTAVYALNDVVDHRIDREKLGLGVDRCAENYLDAVMVRHPIAQGFLSFRDGLLWAIAWGALALIGAYLLNPVCVVIFLAGCTLEAVYCLLLKVTHFRTLVSGAVKTTGAMAAVYAVDPSPSYGFLVCVFVWLFFWEIGGQNVPNDWADIEEDRRLQARTIPVIYGPDRATVIIMGTLLVAVMLSIPVLILSRADFHPVYLLTALGIGLVLLLIPAMQLYNSKDRADAVALFNKSSYYPLSMLLLVVARITLPF